MSIDIAVPCKTLEQFSQEYTSATKYFIPYEHQGDRQPPLADNSKCNKYFSLQQANWCPLKCQECRKST